ncbi:MAG TPA: hypothetical protein VGV15_01945 [Terriglobales bacterium]|nr:hypothetical protein [Terriglobales bacterium]
MDKTAAAAEVPYHARALALALPAMLFGLQIPAWFGFVHIIADGHGDFRQLYAAGYIARTGFARELYDYAAQKRS